MNDERHEELAALYALGALPAAEARAFETELAGDAELRALVRDLQNAAAALAHTSPPMAVPPQLEAQLVAQIHAERAAVVPVRADRRWLAWAALAAIFALVASLVALDRQKLRAQVTALRASEAEAIRLGVERARLAQEIEVLREKETQASAQAAQSTAERAGLKTEVARLTTERTRLEAELSTLQKKDTLASLQIRTLNALLSESRQALASVVWSQEQQRGVLTIEKLKPAGPKEDYQLWVINALTPAPVSVGLIPVDAQGAARYEFTSDAPVGAADKFAISREKKGGGTKPEGPILFLSK